MLLHKEMVARQLEKAKERTKALQLQEATSLSASYKRPWVYDKQEQALFNTKRYALVEASTKAGKAQPLDALISTPHGWKRMGDVQIGDVIHGLNGRTRITGIFPQGKRRTYRITMSDGSSTEASDDHLWRIENSRGNSRILTTEELAARPLWDLRRSYVPQHSAVDYDPAGQLPIDPWLLGYLLGDGCFRGESLELAIGESEIEQQEHISTAISPCTLRHRGNADWRINKPKERYKHPIIQKLKSMGLWGCDSFTKFVPDAYLFASIKDRIAMIQGLLDSDGTVNKHGQPVLEQCSSRISQAFIHIIRSLGGVVRSSVKTSATGNAVYCDTVSIDDPAHLFRMTRKARKCRQPKKPVKKTFRSIEFIGEKDCQCIRVDASDHLYLTDGFIATHNTHGCILWLIEQAIKCSEGQSVWWVAPVNTQAKIAFRRMKRMLPKDSYTATSNPMTIRLNENGALIEFKSAEKPDNLYGDDVYAAVIDEASRCREESWHAVRSTLTATNGPVRIIGNIKGRKNWFYDMARRAEHGDPDMHYAKLIAADAVAAGIVKADEVEAAKRDLPEAVFNELYLAIPNDDGGNPFGIRNIHARIKPLSSLPPVCFGVDLAKSLDWCVIIGLDVNGDVCRFERFQKVPWEEIENRIIAAIGTGIPCLVDSTGVGDPVVERLQKRNPLVTGFKFTSQSKQQIMEGLVVAIQGATIGYPEGVIVSELEAFEYTYTRTGVKYTAPEGQHDDTVCALALAQSIRLKSEGARGFTDWYADQASAAREATKTKTRP